MKLTGQSVVIVGGSAGIGLAVARLALEQGADVTILGRNEDRLAAAAQSLGPVRTLVMDIGSEEQVNRIFGALERVDHVFIAAGTTAIGSILDDTVDEIMAPFVERVWGAVFVVRATAKKIPAGGSVTLTGGLSTDRPVPGSWASGIGTAAAEQLARVLALDLAPIRFNAISPGWTDTPMWDRFFGANKTAIMQSVAEKLPLRKIADPEEVAEAVLLLMTNRSITGESLHVDGGARLV